MRRVMVASPFSGPENVENVKYARLAMYDCIERGESPFVPHLLYPQVLEDSVESEREAAFACSDAWLRQADALVVYSRRGISTGMQREIETATFFGIPVEYRL